MRSAFHSFVRLSSLVFLSLTPTFACNVGGPPRSPLPAASLAAASGPVVAAPIPLPTWVPDTPAGHQLAWVLDAMVRAPTESEVTLHFTSEFLAKVPAPTVVALSRQIATEGPFTLESVTPQPLVPDELVAVVRPAQRPRLRLRLAVEPASGRMRILALQSKIDVKRAGSWGEVQAALQAVAPATNFLASEIEGGKCVPIFAFEPQKTLAIGSVFKLYILDALATQIAEGKHEWEEPVAVQDALKSLPSGAMKDEPAGKTFSVRHFAEQMISLSDNTAADHLLALVGRTAAEDAVKASGHATPSLLQPFLSTREAFAIKLLATPDEWRVYLAADLAHKRTLLEAYAARAVTPAVVQASFKKPTLIDSVEWFASAEDLCKVMADLHARANVAATATVESILSKNPGIPDDTRQYTYVAFKGGSEPGVLNLTWLLRRARDGKWLFLTAGFNDTKLTIDESKAIAATTTAREFLGR